MLQDLRQLFVLCTASQMIGGDFAKFCGLLRIYELKKDHIAALYFILPDLCELNISSLHFSAGLLLYPPKDDD